jgi:hypothetical protein
MYWAPSPARPLRVYTERCVRPNAAAGDKSYTTTTPAALARSAVDANPLTWPHTQRVWNEVETLVGTSVWNGDHFPGDRHS